MLGPQRTGTSWTHDMLKQHSQILVPPCKEMHFFCQHKTEFKGGLFHTHGIGPYIEVMNSAATNHTQDLENLYFLDATACHARHKEHQIANLKLNFPDAKLIMFIRDPVERTWSHFKLNKFGFDTKIDPDSIKIEEVSEFIERSYVRDCDNFTGNIDRWCSHFGKDALHLDWFENIEKNPVELLERVFKFINLPLEQSVLNHIKDKICWTDSVPRTKEIDDLLSQSRKAERDSLVARFGRYK